MKNYFLQDMKELIKSAEADIVFLQEVVGQNEQYKKKGLIDSQFEYLADSVWPHFSYAKNALYDHGHHGNLILSRFPIESWENINLSTNSFEQRGLLVCKLRLPQDKYIYACCVHLDLTHKGRLQQYEMIKNKIRLLEGANLPLVIAGDFNDWNKKSTEVFENEMAMTEVHKFLHGKFARTFPAGFPLLPLDRVYIKNLTATASYIFPPPKKNHFSDHLPLFCEVEIVES
jgi:endonuclease/exonuclease/phosphatase family metal-dependent hydrolase